jgi:hypothetical protein
MLAGPLGQTGRLRIPQRICVVSAVGSAVATMTTTVKPRETSLFVSGARFLGGMLDSISGGLTFATQGQILTAKHILGSIGTLLGLLLLSEGDLRLA